MSKNPSRIWESPSVMTADRYCCLQKIGCYIWCQHSSGEDLSRALPTTPPLYHPPSFQGGEQERVGQDVLQHPPHACQPASWKNWSPDHPSPLSLAHVGQGSKRGVKQGGDRGPDEGAATYSLQQHANTPRPLQYLHRQSTTPPPPTMRTQPVPGMGALQEGRDSCQTGIGDGRVHRGCYTLVPPICCRWRQASLH